MYFVVYKFDFFHYKNFLFSLFYRDNCLKCTISSSLKSTISIKPLLVGQLDTFFGTLYDHFLQVSLYLFLTWQKLIMTKGSCNIWISRIHQLQEWCKICNLEWLWKSRDLLYSAETSVNRTLFRSRVYPLCIGFIVLASIGSGFACNLLRSLLLSVIMRCSVNAC